MIVPNGNRKTSPLMDAFLDRLANMPSPSQPASPAPAPAPSPQPQQADFSSLLDRVLGVQPTRPSMNDTIGEVAKQIGPSEIKLVGPRVIRPEFLRG